MDRPNTQDKTCGCYKICPQCINVFSDTFTIFRWLLSYSLDQQLIPFFASIHLFSVIFTVHIHMAAFIFRRSAIPQRVCPVCELITCGRPQASLVMITQRYEISFVVELSVSETNLSIYCKGSPEIVRYVFVVFFSSLLLAPLKLLVLSSMKGRHSAIHEYFMRRPCLCKYCPTRQGC